MTQVLKSGDFYHVYILLFTFTFTFPPELQFFPGVQRHGPSPPRWTPIRATSSYWPLRLRAWQSSSPSSKGSTPSRTTTCWLCWTRATSSNSTARTTFWTRTHCPVTSPSHHYPSNVELILIEYFSLLCLLNQFKHKVLNQRWWWRWRATPCPGSSCPPASTLHWWGRTPGSHRRRSYCSHSHNRLNIY